MKSYNLAIPQSANIEMSHALETLIADDEILWESTAVWWGCMLDSFASGLGFIFDVIPDNKPHPSGNSGQADGEIWGFILMVGLFLVTMPIWIPVVILRNMTTKCIVTRRSIDLRSGILFKKHDTIRTQSVENIEMRGVIFGTALVTLRAAGSKIILRRVPRCKKLNSLLVNLTTHCS